MSLRLNLLVLCAAFAIALPVVAQTPPVRSVSDILVALDRVPADPERLKKARETRSTRRRRPGWPADAGGRHSRPQT